MNEPKLVGPVELEVREDAEGAALSSRTACSGAFCASKQHQSIMSSIQRQSAMPYASQELGFFRISSGLRRAFYKRSSMLHVPRTRPCSNEVRCASRWTIQEAAAGLGCNTSSLAIEGVPHKAKQHSGKAALYGLYVGYKPLHLGPNLVRGDPEGVDPRLRCICAWGGAPSPLGPTQRVYPPRKQANSDSSPCSRQPTTHTRRFLQPRGFHGSFASCRS